MTGSDELGRVQQALIPAHVPPGLAWQALRGGRSNAIWRVETAPPLVCKLYRGAAASPLFPNEAGDEWLALDALRGTGLAPEPVAFVETEAGPCILYRHAAGAPPGPGDAAEAGAVLRRLHEMPPPEALRLAPDSAEAWRAEGRAMAARLPAPLAAKLHAHEPPLPDLAPAGRAAFLHGDPVPGNMIAGGGTLTLIDWQCPAAGDPVTDLAIYLSPAMQMLYGVGPLTDTAARAFLRGYGDPATEARYRRAAPLLHWRIAAHCLLRAAEGAPGYAEAAEAELRAAAPAPSPPG